MNDILSEIGISGMCWSAWEFDNGFSYRYANPSPDFWNLWRARKSDVRAAGVRCYPVSGGWEVEQKAEGQQDNVPVKPLAPSAVEEAAVSYRAANLIPDFVAPALDPSRNWSEEQQAIFNHFRSVRRNLVVIARAGTGKTTTIKAAFSQAPEARMLYAVFNKKNQIEAEAAIRDPRVDVLTLHALGYRFIRQMWNNAKQDNFVENDRAKAAAGSLSRYQAPDEVVKNIEKIVGFAKNLHVSPSLADIADIIDQRELDCPDFEAQGWNVQNLSKAALKAMELSKIRDPQSRISFNDMVWLPVAMNWVRRCYDGVVIDEGQDMNLLQLLMAMGSCKEGGRVTVVGDDRQAIYGFRGAAQDGLGMMREKLNAVVLGLTTTYRCPKLVVAEAQKMVPDYHAADSAPEGIIQNLVINSLVEKAEVGDAILSRINAPLMPLCLSLLRKGTPARIEGRDVGKALCTIVRSLKAKSVPQFITKIEAWGQKQINRFKGSKYFEAKAEVVNDQVETLVAVAEGVSSVKEIEDRLMNLFQDSDGKQAPAVILSSVHKAKGLEWNRVFVLSDTFKAKEGEGEEANVYYVAVTRAKQVLTLVSGK